MRRKKTKEEFVAEARKVHGDKYDYSLVEYVDFSTPCPHHLPYSWGVLAAAIGSP